MWKTRAWLNAVRQWVDSVLEAEGLVALSVPTEYVTSPWSTVWTIAITEGTVWFKENCASQRAEGNIHTAVAQLAPQYVDRPMAVDPAQGRIPTRDGGKTVMDASPGGSRGVEVDTLGDLLRDYASMQRLTVNHRRGLERAGLPMVHPGEAAHLAEEQATLMASMPEDDPRHLTTEQRDVVMNALPALTEAADVLVAGPVPLAVDQCDLFPRNVFVPRSEADPYRFFDFAEAVWSHPFGSLVMFVWECLDRWEIAVPDDAVDCQDGRIRDVFDAYFGCWTDLAPIHDLRVAAESALRIAPLHRSGVWLRVLDGAGDAAVAEHGGTPWAWLQDVAKPVRL